MCDFPNIWSKRSFVANLGYVVITRFFRGDFSDFGVYFFIFETLSSTVYPHRLLGGQSFRLV